MIRREIAVWMGLEHPNITPFLGVVTGFGPLSAMVSPYCSKETIVRYTLENPVVDRLPLVSFACCSLLGESPDSKDRL